MAGATRSPAKRPARSHGGSGSAWRVIVLNDDHNTFEGVAFALAERIHTTGQTIVWSGHREAAELYHSGLEDFGLTLAPLER